MSFILDIQSILDAAAAGKRVTGKLGPLRKIIEGHNLYGFRVNYPYPMRAEELAAVFGDLGDRIDASLALWMLQGNPEPPTCINNGFWPLEPQEMIDIRNERIEQARDDGTLRSKFLAEEFLPFMRRDAEMIMIMLARPPITHSECLIYYSDELWSQTLAVCRAVTAFLGLGRDMQRWGDGLLDRQPMPDSDMFPAFRP